MEISLFRMPIQSVWCVGKNYLDHINEMRAITDEQKNEKSAITSAHGPEEPVVFLKSPACLVSSAEKIILPKDLGPIHHELELAFIINENFEAESVGLALDLTARSVQTAAKAKGQPWTLAKSFKGACPVTSFLNIKELAHQHQIRPDGIFQQFGFSLYKNKKLMQLGHFNKAVFSWPKILDYLKRHFPLLPGDLILTGTPSGVGELQVGDILHLQLFLNLSLQQNEILILEHSFFVA